MRQNLDTRAFSLFVNTRKAPLRPPIEPASIGSAGLCLGHSKTIAGSKTITFLACLDAEKQDFELLQFLKMIHV